MVEYTRDDIIIFSDDERLKDAIGKECYFSDYPNYIITQINEDDCSLSKLLETKLNYRYPFLNIEGRSYKCIIIKKEEPKPKYVPFKTLEEFIRAYSNHVPQKDDSNGKIMFFNGMWLKWNYEYIAVTHITDIGINNGDSFTDWKDLCDNYTFLDGTPCGKLKEVKNG